MHVLVLLLALFSWSLTHGSDQLDFRRWSSVFLPDATREELDAIYPTWKKNAELVSDHHNQQNSQFTMTLNKFAHLTLDQVPKIPSRFISPLPEPTETKILSENASLTDSFDWRDHNMITPVHDQGQIDCSNSLVLSDAISSLHAILSKDPLVQFSYLQLEVCCWYCNCFGSANIDCITKLNLCPMSLYPSQPSFQCNCFDEKECTFHVKGMRAVPAGQESALQSAVLISPVMATIDVPVSMQLYKSGIFSSKNCSSTQLNHMILVVGYGENDSGEKYWICKNSWGVDWGMDGYFLLARDQNNMCGIAAQASYLYA